ncbi:unnamed protein product, partial [Ectocarpus fasciculatus]
EADVGGYNINTLLNTTTTLRRHLARGIWVRVSPARGSLFDVGDVATEQPRLQKTTSSFPFSGPSYFTLTALFRDVPKPRNSGGKPPVHYP